MNTVHLSDVHGRAELYHLTPGKAISVQTAPTILFGADQSNIQQFSKQHDDLQVTFIDESSVTLKNFFSDDSASTLISFTDIYLNVQAINKLFHLPASGRGVSRDEFVGRENIIDSSEVVTVTHSSIVFASSPHTPQDEIYLGKADISYIKEDADGKILQKYFTNDNEGTVKSGGNVSNLDAAIDHNKLDLQSLNSNELKEDMIGADQPTKENSDSVTFQHVINNPASTKHTITIEAPDQSEDLAKTTQEESLISSDNTHSHENALGSPFENFEQWRGSFSTDLIHSSVLDAASGNTVSVILVNGMPVFSANNIFINQNGASLTLAQNHINAFDDNDSGSDVTYTLSNVTNGQFELVSDPGNAITSFTQAQVLASEIQFVHGGGNAAPSYQITATDGDSAVTAVSNGMVTYMDTSSIIDADNLNGINGITINGVEATSYTGLVGDSGDFNGDGYMDILVSGHYADGLGTDRGETYVVFGDADGFSADIDLSTIGGANGFVIHGINDNDHSGASSSTVGDINNDGIDDIIIGARDADPNGNQSGQTYVVFGRNDGISTFELSTLDGTNGFYLNGINTGDVGTGDWLGWSVNDAGDLNGDGIADLIVGSTHADANGVVNAGQAYVIYGSNSAFAATIDLATLDGTDGTTFNGVAAQDVTGTSVTGIGDVNGDGYDDIAIGSRNADPNGRTDAGSTYVVFGTGSSLGASFDLADLDNTNGFVIQGATAGDQAGYDVNVIGDINGDGYQDLSISTRTSGAGLGKSYVVYGHSGPYATIDLASVDGTNGFSITGTATGDWSGFHAKSLGDVNGDGIDDIFISGPKVGMEDSYILFGNTAGFGSNFNVTDIDGTNGIVIDGSSGIGAGGNAAAAGDINNDGFNDIYVPAANANGNVGESYLIYGGDFSGAVDHLGGTGDDSLIGDGTDEVLIGGQGNDTITGNGGADRMLGAAGDDILVFDTIDLTRANETAELNGGTGSDTLQLDASGETIDLTTIDNDILLGIEYLDITGTGNNTLILDATDVLDITDLNDKLFIDGNSGDQVTLDNTNGAWSLAAADETGYAKYTATISGTPNTVTLYVDEDISII